MSTIILNYFLSRPACVCGRFPLGRPFFHPPSLAFFFEAAAFLGVVIEPSLAAISEGVTSISFLHFGQMIFFIDKLDTIGRYMSN